MTSAPRPSASRPRVIERWFPCAEVSAASGSGWGSSNSETLLMSWFAKRPLAQSRAAVLCSLLPWPEDPAEQERVQAVLRESLGVCQDDSWYACGVESCEKLDCTKKSHMQQANRPHAHGIADCAKLDPTGGYDAARTDVLRLLKDAYPDRPAEMLDPFSGRGLIPLEAARYGQQAHAIDYSPVATLASRLLIDWPFRDWSNEPELPFDPPGNQVAAFDPSDPQRLIRDIATVQAEVQRRLEKELDEFYPDNGHGEKPWGYFWAQVIPCDGCGREFPLVGSGVLVPASGSSSGQSFEVVADTEAWHVRLRDDADAKPTMRHRSGSRKGKLAWCPYTDCGHAHELKEHKALVVQHYSNVAMLLVSDNEPSGKKSYRLPTMEEQNAAQSAASRAVSLEVNGLPAIPHERMIEKDHDTIRAVAVGAKTFGDLSLARQNLMHATVARAIASIGREMVASGTSDAYASCLTGYLGATLVKKLRRSSRGVWLDAPRSGVTGVFVNESTLGFNYDFFETGIGAGPGTWDSVSGVPSTLRVLRSTSGRPAKVNRGSARVLPHGRRMDAIVTDPPYEAMLEYADASDYFYVWLRRALLDLHAEFALTANPRGTQENSDEMIVKKMHSFVDDHRTPQHYREGITAAFAQCSRSVHFDGVVSIVFGHGDPDAWRSLLESISEAGLTLTGAWPANTEKGGQAGSANIQTTLTLACRPAPPSRPDGRVAEVDAEMRQVIAERVRTVWNPSGLSYVDQKMAAAGPALEVVGRYGRILDKRGQPVDLTRYLPLARQAVTEAHNLSFDSLPLDTFDQKTRFALEWVRSFGRKVQAASEARWQRFAADLEESDTAGVLTQVDKGVRLAFATEAKVEPVEGLSLFEVALAAASAWRDGTLADAAAVIRTCKVEPDDPHFWACLRALSQNLPETDKDGAVWTSMVRNRDALAAGIANAEAAAQAVVDRERQEVQTAEMNPALFEDPNSLFGQEGN